MHGERIKKGIKGVLALPAYGCEAWPFAIKDQRNRARVFEREFLRY
jgi:hypothetical protein